MYAHTTPMVASYPFACLSTLTQHVMYIAYCGNLQNPCYFCLFFSCYVLVGFSDIHEPLSVLIVKQNAQFTRFFNILNTMQFTRCKPSPIRDIHHRTFELKKFYISKKRTNGQMCFVIFSSCCSAPKVTTFSYSFVLIQYKYECADRFTTAKFLF